MGTGNKKTKVNNTSTKVSNSFGDLSSFVDVDKVLATKPNEPLAKRVENMMKDKG